MIPACAVVQATRVGGVHGFGVVSPSGNEAGRPAFFQSIAREGQSRFVQGVEPPPSVQAWACAPAVPTTQTKNKINKTARGVLFISLKALKARGSIACLECEIQNGTASGAALTGRYHWGPSKFAATDISLSNDGRGSTARRYIVDILKYIGPLLDCPNYGRFPHRERKRRIGARGCRRAHVKLRSSNRGMGKHENIVLVFSGPSRTLIVTHQ